MGLISRGRIGGKGGEIVFDGGRGGWKRCHELVPTAPARPVGDTWNVMSRPHVPKWYEGTAELQNDWVMESDLDTEEILMGDQ